MGWILNIISVILIIVLIFLAIVIYHQDKKKEFNWELPLTPNKGLIINFDGEKTVHIGFYNIKD